MNKHRLKLHLPFALMLTCACIALLAGCSAMTAADSEPAALEEIWSRYPELRGQPYSQERVKRVIDGDTFETSSGAKVRLIGVNTPETTGGKSEAYGKEAAAYTQKMLEGKSVLLFEDAGNTDRYGRLLR